MSAQGKDVPDSESNDSTRETNYLFATSAAEEGVDVLECDVIIRFDLCVSANQIFVQKPSLTKVVALVYHGVNQEHTPLFPAVAFRQTPPIAHREAPGALTSSALFSGMLCGAAWLSPSKYRKLVVSNNRQTLQLGIYRSYLGRLGTVGLRRPLEVSALQNTQEWLKNETDNDVGAHWMAEMANA